MNFKVGDTVYLSKNGVSIRIEDKPRVITGLKYSKKTYLGPDELYYYTIEYGEWT
jgi:hypothetical protein